MIPISVTILTKNSDRTLHPVLKALADFDEVLVGDTGSKDHTKEIAHSFPNVKVVDLPFEGFGKTHNALSDQAKHEWILSVDSDEIVSQELLEEIKGLTLDPKTVYSVPRHNMYRGIWIKTCGWYPDRVFRLYNRMSSRFTLHKVHERVDTNGLNEKDLEGWLTHTPYMDVDDFLVKMRSYSTLFAEEYKGKKMGGPFTALLHAKAAFFKSYLLEGGISQGGVGLEISIYKFATAFYKYLKLGEANRRH